VWRRQETGDPALGVAGLRARTERRSPSASGAGDGDGEDAGGVPVEGLAARVIAHRGSRVGVAGRFVHITQRESSVQRGGDERA
jgi:hypothetical protein